MPEKHGEKCSIYYCRTRFHRMISIYSSLTVGTTNNKVDMISTIIIYEI